MAGFDFSQIGDIISQCMDSDYIDIKRDVTGSLMEIYSNIPCHIEFMTSDNPDPYTVDIKPKIQSLNIHLPIWVDVKNNDYIVAKKMSNDNKVLEVYSGRCGNPMLNQSRKNIIIGTISTDNVQPTPPPATDPSKITINYISGGMGIIDELVIKAQKGEEITIKAVDIDGYKVQEVYLNDEVVGKDSITFIVEDDYYDVSFVYEELQGIEAINYFRYLIEGLYTEDDGNLIYGLHQYKKTPIKVIDEVIGVYTLESRNHSEYHPDENRFLSISVGTKLVLYSGEIFVKVTEILGVEDGMIKFKAQTYEPSEKELNSYVTRWYD